MQLPPFDSNRATGETNYQRAHFQLPTSMVALVDSTIETIVQVYFGTHDQLVAEEMDGVLKTAEFPQERFIPAADPRFENLRSLLFKLQTPVVCRKAEIILRSKGYLVDPAEFYSVLKAAGDKQYSSISAHGWEKQYNIGNRFQCYTLIGIALRK